MGTLAINALRMDKGFRLWGADMNKDTTPLEAGLGFFVKHNSPKKKDFIGREALLKVERQGLARKLVPMAVDASDCMYVETRSLENLLSFLLLVCPKDRKPHVSS